MRHKQWARRVILSTLMMFVFSLWGCGGSSSDLPASNGSSGELNDDQGDGGLSQTSIVITTVTVTADPEIVLQGGTSDIEATVLDQFGDTIKDGTLVIFSMSDESLGTIGLSATTLNGVAKATLSVSSDNVGVLTVTARAGSVTGTVDVDVVEPAAVNDHETILSVSPYKLKRLQNLT